MSLSEPSPRSSEESEEDDRESAEIDEDEEGLKEGDRGEDRPCGGLELPSSPSSPPALVEMELSEIDEEPWRRRCLW